MAKLQSGAVWNQAPEPNLAIWEGAQEVELKLPNYLLWKELCNFHKGHLRTKMFPCCRSLFCKILCCCFCKSLHSYQVCFCIKVQRWGRVWRCILPLQFLLPGLGQHRSWARWDIANSSSKTSVQQTLGFLCAAQPHFSPIDNCVVLQAVSVQGKPGLLLPSPPPFPHGGCLLLAKINEALIQAQWNLWGSFCWLPDICLLWVALGTLRNSWFLPLLYLSWPWPTPCCAGLL